MTVGAELPALPLEAWEPTKDTLHRWAQILGKIKLAATHPRNHWWNSTLHVSPRGFTTRRLQLDGRLFELELDAVDHRLVLRCDTSAETSLPLRDGLSVAGFLAGMQELLAAQGIAPDIRAVPYDLADTTSFADDERHASYDAAAVHDFWRATAWVEWVLDEFAGWFCGKASPVHLFWHSFDLAYARFSGRRAPDRGADPVTREAYSHEVISFGFWAGDANVRAPAFYSYTAPEPDALTAQPLRPPGAAWRTGPTGSLALLMYDDVRTSASPRDTLLAFFESAYRAGAGTAGWDAEDLMTSWCPPVPDVLARVPAPVDRSTHRSSRSDSGPS